jgi:hypothetical protein
MRWSTSDRRSAGATRIGAWREGPASQYIYTTEVAAIEPTGDARYRASGRPEGNLPGGTPDLNWDLTIAAGLISRLDIAPRHRRRPTLRRNTPLMPSGWAS